MITKRWLIFVSALLVGGCGSDPPVQVPEQRSEVAAPPSLRPSILQAGSPEMQRYIVADIGAIEQGAWRWTGKRPTVKFQVETNDKFTYVIDFALVDGMFTATGPVTLKFFVSDHTLESVRYDKPGGHHFEKAVPPEWIDIGKETLVGAELDKLYTASGSDGPLGFILGFIGLKAQ